MVNNLNACSYIIGVINFEHLDRPSRPPPKPSIEESPKLELKTLPSQLNYAYLGANETLVVVVSSDLSDLQEEKLLKVLESTSVQLDGPWLLYVELAHLFGCTKFS